MQLLIVGLVCTYAATAKLDITRLAVTYSMLVINKVLYLTGTAFKQINIGIVLVNYLYVVSLKAFLNYWLGKIWREIGMSHEILVDSCCVEIDVAAIDTLIVVFLAEKSFISEFMWEMDKLWTTETYLADKLFSSVQIIQAHFFFATTIDTVRSWSCRCPILDHLVLQTIENWNLKPTAPYHCSNRIRFII